VQESPLDEIDGPKLKKTIPKSLSMDEVDRLFSLPDLGSYLGFRDRCIMELFIAQGLGSQSLWGLIRGF
jgi:integrase/recombinase XerC